MYTGCTNSKWQEIKNTLKNIIWYFFYCVARDTRRKLDVDEENCLWHVKAGMNKKIKPWLQSTSCMILGIRKKCFNLHGLVFEQWVSGMLTTQFSTCDSSECLDWLLRLDGHNLNTLHSRTFFPEILVVSLWLHRIWNLLVKLWNSNAK